MFLGRRLDAPALDRFIEKVNLEVFLQISKWAREASTKLIHYFIRYTLMDNLKSTPKE
jgi:hypothetical protein